MQNDEFSNFLIVAHELLRMSAATHRSTAAGFLASNRSTVWNASEGSTPIVAAAPRKLEMFSIIRKGIDLLLSFRIVPGLMALMSSHSVTPDLSAATKSSPSTSTPRPPIQARTSASRARSYFPAIFFASVASSPSAARAELLP